MQLKAEIMSDPRDDKKQDKRTKPAGPITTEAKYSADMPKKTDAEHAAKSPKK